MPTTPPEIWDSKETAVIIDKQTASNSLNSSDFLDLLTISNKNIIASIETVRTRPEESQGEIESNDRIDRRKRSKNGKATIDLEVISVVERNLDMSVVQYWNLDMSLVYKPNLIIERENEAIRLVDKGESSRSFWKLETEITEIHLIAYNTLGLRVQMRMTSRGRKRHVSRDNPRISTPF